MAEGTRGLKRMRAATERLFFAHLGIGQTRGGKGKRGC